MITVREHIENAYTKVNGEYESIIESSDDYKTYLNVLNQVMQIWKDTPYVKWQSLFDMDYRLPDAVELDRLVYPFAATDTVTLGNTPFDSVYFVNGTGTVVDKYKMTDQAFFSATNDQKVCMVAANGLNLKSAPASLVGTNIRVPAYVAPPKYATPEQVVNVDSDSWLSTYMAAFICDASPVPFIARNADKYYKQADILMKTMRDNNRKKQHLVIKSWGDLSRHTWQDVMRVMATKDL